MALAPRRLPQGSASTLDRYLTEIAAFPLIDRSEEARLARRIRAGDHEALATLVRANLRFVVSVAKRYQNQGVPLLDLINEGNMGLIRAAHRFDEGRGVKFISYAVWWIRQAMLEALAEQSRIVRVPLNRAGQVHKVTRSQDRLRAELGRDPTEGEIAVDLGISPGDVAVALRVGQAHLSLDAPANATDDGRLMDYLPAEGGESDASAVESSVRAGIKEAVRSLGPRQAKILCLYFGLDGQPPMTLESIGAQLGVTRERVRQIKELALQRLRHPSRVRNLQALQN